MVLRSGRSLSMVMEAAPVVSIKIVMNTKIMLCIFKNLSLQIQYQMILRITNSHEDITILFEQMYLQPQSVVFSTISSQKGIVLDLSTANYLCFTNCQNYWDFTYIISASNRHHSIQLSHQLQSTLNNVVNICAVYHSLNNYLLWCIETPNKHQIGTNRILIVKLQDNEGLFSLTLHRQRLMAQFVHQNIQQISSQTQQITQLKYSTEIKVCRSGHIQILIRDMYRQNGLVIVQYRLICIDRSMVDYDNESAEIKLFLNCPKIVQRGNQQIKYLENYRNEDNEKFLMSYQEVRSSDEAGNIKFTLHLLKDNSSKQSVAPPAKTITLKQQLYRNPQSDKIEQLICNIHYIQQSKLQILAITYRNSNYRLITFSQHSDDISENFLIDNSIIIVDTQVVAGANQHILSILCENVVTKKSTIYIHRRKIGESSWKRVNIVDLEEKFERLVEFWISYTPKFGYFLTVVCEQELGKMNLIQIRLIEKHILYMKMIKEMIGDQHQTQKIGNQILGLLY